MGAGKPGCETNTIDYQGAVASEPKITWDKLKDEEFKVVFQLPRDLSFVGANQEMIAKYYQDMWMWKFPNGKYLLFNMCPPLQDFDKKQVFCILNLQLKLDLDTGFFTFSE